MKKLTQYFFIFLINIISLNSYSAITIPADKKIPERLQEDFEKINNFKMPKKFFTFMYTEKFAKIVRDDDIGKFERLKISEATKEDMGDILAIGLSVTETKPETKDRFAEYHCTYHFFVPYKDDYWLPEGEYGDWFGYRDLEDEISNDLNDTGIRMINMEDYSNRGYLGKYSSAPSKFKKHIFPNVTYLEYKEPCFNINKVKYSGELWVEKKDGPDLHYTHYEPAQAKDFHVYKIPKTLLKNACQYVQIANTRYYWNRGARLGENFKPQFVDIKLSEEIYPCN